jgi:hypothetical protein
MRPQIEDTAGRTYYVVLWNDDSGLVWRTSGTPAFETWSDSHANRAIAPTLESGGMYKWESLPGGSGHRRGSIFLQTGASPSRAADIERRRFTGYYDSTTAHLLDGAQVADIATAAAAAILVTPANKLATNASGHVTTANPASGAQQVQINTDEVIIE